MQILSSVLDKLVAFETTSPLGRVDCGTAFWLTIGGAVKLVTASHIPWPQTTSPPTPVTSGTVLQVRWSMQGGSSGAGSARFVAHHGAPGIDYCWMVFLDASQAPPVMPPFRSASAPPPVQTPVAATGFPGAFMPANPVAKSAIGIVNAVQPLSAGGRISVGGSACGGYSGGPAFEYIDTDQLGDEVIGLMCGAPTPQATANQGLASSYVLQGSGTFI